MKLAAYIKSRPNKSHRTAAYFAKKSGIDPRMISRYILGLTLPSAKNMYRIYKASGGRVNLKDWFQ